MCNKKILLNKFNKSQKTNNINNFNNNKLKNKNKIHWMILFYINLYKKPVIRIFSNINKINNKIIIIIFHNK